MPTRTNSAASSLGSSVVPRSWAGEEAAQTTYHGSRKAGEGRATWPQGRTIYTEPGAGEAAEQRHSLPDESQRIRRLARVGRARAAVAPGMALKGEPRQWGGLPFPSRGGVVVADDNAVAAALQRRVAELERYCRALERRLAEMQADQVLRDAAAAVAANPDENREEYAC